MACDCLHKTNAFLAEHNTRLPATVTLPLNGEPSREMVTLLTEKIAPRGKRPVVMAPTYCPFCGVPYRPIADTVDDQAGAQVAA